MEQIAYCLFDTPLGRCGIAWIEDDDLRIPTVTAIQLPEATLQLTETKLKNASGGRKIAAPPSAIAAIIRKIIRHLQGDLQDFRDVYIGLDGFGPFARKVYAAARNISAGKIKTYGELARAIRNPAAARAVGQALGRNPIPLIIPCHRIVAAGKKPGGFSAPGGTATKVRLLALEGVALQHAAIRGKGKTNAKTHRPVQQGK